MWPVVPVGPGLATHGVLALRGGASPRVVRRTLVLRFTLDYSGSAPEMRRSRGLFSGRTTAATKHGRLFGLDLGGLADTANHM